MQGETRQVTPEALRGRLREGRLPCAEAFALAHELGIAPLDVAAAAEAQGARIGWCQLGLFGALRKHERRAAGLPEEERPAAGAGEVPAALREQIEAACEDGRLPCARAWAVARRLGLERPAVARAADALGVRISRCQLGCF